MNPLANALELLQALNALRPISESQEKRIWQKFRLDWNFHSNHLEGNSLTYGETKSLLLHNITAQGKPLKDHLEITGHNEALLEIHDAVKQQRPITEAFLRQVHILILKERYQVDAQTAEGQATKKWVEVGQYKTQPNHVVTATGETFRFAEPFEVAAKMEKLVQEANSACSTPQEGLLLAAKLHYQFVLIHPFDDGNGRMARILMNLVLMRHGFPPAIIKTQAKEDYFSALRQADGGQFEVFAEYIAARVEENLKIMIAGAKGEEIDEPDDLDKKISLFIGLATEKNGKLPAIRTDELITAFCDKALLPIIKLLHLKTRKLALLYANSEQTLEDNVSLAKISFDELVDLSEFPRNSEFLFLICDINQQFNQLSLTMGKHSYQSQIVLVFGLYEITASNVDAKQSISILYNENNFTPFIQEVVKVELERHLSWLNEVNGIDTAA